MSNGLQMTRRIRRTPYTDRVEALGVSGFTVVNHTLLPKAFGHSVQDDYWHLREHVQLWDVGCQRQVEIQGPDATRLVQWMTPRDMRGVRVGQCVYTPLVDHKGLLVNDPITLKLAEDRYWLSIADSDVALYALGLARGAGLDAEVEEADIWPLAIQGPEAETVVSALFGNHLKDLGFFAFTTIELDGRPCVIARSGYSGQGGFEVYADPTQGQLAWDQLWEAGQAHAMRPGCPNLIDRIETGLISFGNDMTRDDSPLEAGLSRWCDLEVDTGCIGLAALRAQRDKGIQRQLCGLVFDAPPDQVCAQPWPVEQDGHPVGSLTSAVYSPRFKAHVGLGILAVGAAQPGQAVTVRIPERDAAPGKVHALPFTTQSDNLS